MKRGSLAIYLFVYLEKKEISKGRLSSEKVFLFWGKRGKGRATTVGKRYLLSRKKKEKKTASKKAAADRRAKEHRFMKDDVDLKKANNLEQICLCVLKRKRRARISKSRGERVYILRKRREPHKREKKSSQIQEKALPPPIRGLGGKKV